MWNGRQDHLWRGAYVLAVSGLIFAAYADRSYDDPYITFRYAANLAHGLGFVYNQGERVLSTTTPLFALILATLSPLTADLPRLANLIGALCLAGGALCIWEMAILNQRRVVGWLGLLLYPAFSLLINSLGSEMPLYLLLCLAAILFYQRKQFSLAAVCAGLATVTRPDGVLVAALLAGHALVTARRVSSASEGRYGDRPLHNGRALVTAWDATPASAGRYGDWPLHIGRALVTAWDATPASAGRYGDRPLHNGLIAPKILPFVIFVLMSGFWFSFAWLYYGSPLPATLAAKQAQGSMANSQLFLPGALTIWRDYQAYITSWLMLALALIGLLALRRETGAPGVWLIPAWSLLQAVAYSVSGVTRYYWYYTPLIPGFIVLAGLGLDALLNLLPRYVPGLAPHWKTVAEAVCVCVMASGLLQQDVLLLQQTDQRLNIYRAVGSWLQANTDTRATVATLEAGIIGYYAQRPLVDFAGLVRPEVAKQLAHASNYDDAAVWTLDRYAPDYVVVRSGSLPRLELSLAAQACSAAQVFKGADYGYDGDMAIYHCQRPAGGA